MNFNALVNTNGIKGSRRGGESSKLKDIAQKAAGATKQAATTTVTTIKGIAPATNNRVSRIEEDSLVRDMELIYEVRKTREALNEVRAVLAMEEVPASTQEEVNAAVQAMFEANAQKHQTQKEALADEGLMGKLQGALKTIGKKLPKQAAPAPVEEPVAEAPVVGGIGVIEEVVAEPVAQPVAQTGATRKLVSSPAASKYDYSELSEQV